MRIALISDIHGNLPALEAVYADIQAAGVDEIICLGDVANIGPYPAECLDFIQSLGCVTLQGNHELYLLGSHLPADWQTCPTWAPVRWARTQLTAAHFEFMSALPFAHELPANGLAPAVFVHACLVDQFLGFKAEYTDDETAVRMNGRDDITLFCAHTHRPLYRLWSNSRIVNIGSVGMPLDDTPAAKYVIATRHKSSWNVEFRHVAYDVTAVMAAFDRGGLQAAGGLITGLFRYQMLTGRRVASPFLAILHRLARERRISAAAMLREMPVPDYVRPFLNNGS